MNNMTIILFVIAAGLGLSAHAGMLAGPLVNPANGHSYYLLSQNTWSNAEAEAVSLGGHLATIRNAGEQQWVFSTFGTYGGALWIGLTDRDRVFTFTWTSGEPRRYTNWSDTEPDNGTGGIEYYTHMWPGNPQFRAPAQMCRFLIPRESTRMDTTGYRLRNEMGAAQPASGMDGGTPFL